VLGEVAVVAFAGAGIGFGLTYGLLGAFTSIIPAELTWSWFEAPVMNARVFLFALLAVVVAMAVAGGLPAWRASRVDRASRSRMAPARRPAVGDRTSAFW